MTRPRKLLSLRAVLVLVLVLSTALVSTMTATALVLAARANIFEARQNVLLDQFRDTTDTLIKQISAQDDSITLEYRSQNLPGRTSIIDLTSKRAYGALTRQDIPAAISDGWSDPSGAVRFLRINEPRGPTFYIGTVTSTLPRDPGARVAIVTAFSLAPERAQVQHLVSVAALIGLGAVLLAVVIAIWLGTLLTRPIRRLAERARHLGQDSAAEPALRSRFRDVDDVARALHDSATSLNASIDELRRREGHARRLVSDVAHELRTPLTSMMAVSEILDDFADADPEDRDVAIGITRRGTDRLSALVNEVLELSRIDAGVRRVDSSPVDLGELLQDVVDLSAPTEDVTVECPPGTVLQTDPSLLRKIVSNLITNAVRHGTPPISIVATVGDEVQVRVIDTGTGIASADTDRVFDRFTMLDAGRRDQDSTGIGLAIAREAAQLLGGNLVLESTAPTTFLLTLPRTLPAL
ncbi:hypothetical protein DEJ27_08365 [Curtobacterium sp. MCPF17_018]|uniref:sensor histidine kinase n=1 Tax=Curtobacterium sp. MCPF17_018 TaxID=2175638 RepID=UPI000DA9C369|nr:HAMP domain-containing sensor histidine kinase [Curtobacterium sp. MCPF17_018]PZE69289.1 hypothetical protein DEJ27_08365 [Curtobacterium sp. MCPF17_018]